MTGGHVIKTTTTNNNKNQKHKNTVVVLSPDITDFASFFFFQIFPLHRRWFSLPLKVLLLEAIFIYFLQVHLQGITAGGQILYFMLSKPICCELFTLLSEVPVNGFVFGAVQTTNRDSEKAVSELVAPQWALEGEGGEEKRKKK